MKATALLARKRRAKTAPAPAPPPGSPAQLAPETKYVVGLIVPDAQRCY